MRLSCFNFEKRVTRMLLRMDAGQHQPSPGECFRHLGNAQICSDPLGDLFVMAVTHHNYSTSRLGHLVKSFGRCFFLVGTRGETDKLTPQQESFENGCNDNAINGY